MVISVTVFVKYFFAYSGKEDVLLYNRYVIHFRCITICEHDALTPHRYFRKKESPWKGLSEEGQEGLSMYLLS